MSELKLFLLQPKIDMVNQLVNTYFQVYPNDNTVTPQQLEDFASSLGMNISSNAIRNALRDLDDLGELSRIPHIKPIRKKRVTYWEFDKNEIFRGIQ